MTEEVMCPGIDPRIRVFRHAAILDTFVIRTERCLILVDTATRREDMARVMEAVQDDLPGRLLFIINTHGDWDHVWGNSLFAASDAEYPAPILAHRLAAARMQGARAEAQLASRQSAEPDRYGGVVWCLPTVLIEGPGRIDGGDLSIDLIPTPGHTPDHYALWLPDLRLLIAGDAAEMPFPLVSGDGSLPALRASLAQMTALEPSTVLYCHAPGITSPGLLIENSRYFDELESRAGEYGPALMSAENPAGALGWPADDIIARLHPAADQETLTFYRGFHDANIRAAAQHLFGS